VHMTNFYLSQFYQLPLQMSAKTQFFL